MARELRLLVCAMTLAGSAMVLPVRAADNLSKPSQPAGAAAKGPKSDQPSGPVVEPEKSGTLREQNIYIPYEKLRQVFEKHGRGVFLPYEKFEQLWRAAREENRPAAEARPPVGALITDIENEATVAKDVVRVKAAIKIDLLAEGWHEVPLRLSDAAITRATVGGEPARIVGGPGEDYKLLVEKKGRQPEQIELLLEYAKAITRMPGQNSVAFQAPQASVSRWRVRIPQQGVKINIQPFLAATDELPAETPATAPKGKNAEASKAETRKPDETVVLAFVGAASTVRIEWTPKVEGATGLAALASVQAEQQIWLNEGVTRCRANLAYTISRAELGQLAIEVPADYKVVNVSDANVRQWSVEPVRAGAAVQKITAQLFEPAKTSQQVSIELEKYSAEKRQDALHAPVVKALGVGRQQGAVVVHVAPALRAEARQSSGLLQVDAAELPGALAAGRPAFAYRYAAVPFELELAIEEVQARVTADSLVETYLEPQRLAMDLTAVYHIEGAGVFRLELDVPEGFDVRQVRGREVNLAVTPPTGGTGGGMGGMGGMGMGGGFFDVPPEIVQAAPRKPARRKPATQQSPSEQNPFSDDGSIGPPPAKPAADDDPFGPPAKPSTKPNPVAPARPAADVPAAPQASAATAPPPAAQPPAAEPAAPAAEKAVPVEVESYHLDGEKKTRLVVELKHKATGRVALGVLLQKELQEPVLLSADKAAEVPLNVPGVAPGSVERATGRLVIYAPDNLLTSAPVQEGLRSISFKEALEGLRPTREPRKSEARPVLCFALAQEPISLRLSVQRRKSLVSVYQLLVARIEERMARCQATLAYNVQFSGVKSLRIDLPAGVAQTARITTQGMTKKPIAPPPPDLAKGCVAWNVSGESEFKGDVKIELEWDKNLGELDIGQSINFILLPLVPKGTDLAWGQIVLTKAETLDVAETDDVKGLRRIDPHDVARRVANAAAAFEFHQEDWTLPVAITRYKLHDVKWTSIDRAVVRQVVTPAGGIAVQGLFQVRSARQRLPINLPADCKFDNEPARINGRAVTLGQEQPGQYFVPLPAANPDEPFLLELRYTLDVQGQTLELPVFAEDIAVQKVYLSAYVPEARALLGEAGPWTEEFRWWMSPSLKWVPAQADGEKLDDKYLVDWVREGVKSPGTTPDFHTDGRLFLYSTLRPADNGAMTMRMMDERLLNVWVFAPVVLGGLLLVRTGLRRRALAVGAMLVVLVLAAVFVPTFSLQLLNGVLVGALFVVLVIWGVAYLAQRGPAEPAQRRPAASVKSPAMPTVEAIVNGLEAAAEAGLPIDAPLKSQASPETPRPEEEGGRHE
jgi:hypothetical protein